MREWNASTYHRVSNPQTEWGVRVLDRLELDGSELVLDVGCGTGRLTDKLVERLPRGRAIAIDQSWNMLTTARGFLGPRHATRVCFVQGDAAALPVASRADVIFSTATFHWIVDHPALFRSLIAALKPGGRLVAQCGGGPNLRRLRERTLAMMEEPQFAPHFSTWRDPWEFAEADTARDRLVQAGFTHVTTSTEPAPVVLPDAAEYREYVAHVICRPHLACLPSDALRDAFLDRLTAQAAADPVPFELDYWRLNLSGAKPT